MRRSTDRILTTHVGSLIRPAALLQHAARQQPQQLPRYQEAVREATVEVVQQQVKAGLDVINDGEYGKSSWANYVLDRMTGFEFRPDTIYEATWLGRDRFRFAEFMKAQFPRGVTGAPGHACVGPIRYQGHDAVRRNIRDLKAALAATGITEGFMTAVAPASTGYDASNEYYKDERDYVFAIAEALREEYLEIVNAGLVLQVDDAVLANMYDEFVQQSPANVSAVGRTARRRAEPRAARHPRGSRPVPHLLRQLARAARRRRAARGDLPLMLKVHAGAYSIEAANVRHEHEWRLWQSVKLPPGKILIPGVVTHHTTSIEHPRLVADRIVRFAELVGRENVIAGTDCGFAQLEQYQRVHPQVMWAKLEALAEGAQIASQELWRR